MLTLDGGISFEKSLMRSNETSGYTTFLYKFLDGIIFSYFSLETLEVLSFDNVLLVYLEFPVLF